MKQLPILLALLFSLLLFSCKKDSFITTNDASISLSADTLRFDTVFTSVGSTTQYFKLVNDNRQKLLISNITLKGGAASAFKMNVDGISAAEVKNVELEANDSMYVFVSVLAAGSNSNRPFIIQDSIEIAFNGNKQWVQLETWGKNANFLRSRKISGHVTWTNNLPYVILGGLQVDTNATLTIQKGCRIYLHADAPFIVDGTLQVNGGAADSDRVTFRGDRLDEPYSNYPASWPGMYFRGLSKDNLLNFANIRNAYQGIVIEKPSVNANPKLTLNQCILDNIYDAGILAVQSSIQAVNCLVSNAGKNIQLLYGGSYQFTHCTVASYSSSYFSHSLPVLQISNNTVEGSAIISADLSANFKNCIFWGESGIVDDEVVTSKQGSGNFTVNFSNCLWKVKNAPGNVVSSNIINNQDPGFDSINTQKHYFDFRLLSGSPAIDKGINAGISNDLDGMPRPVRQPDLGAYEKQ